MNAPRWADRLRVLEEVLAELNRQDEEHGTIESGNGIRRPLQRLGILVEEVGEVADEVTIGAHARARAEYVQVAAVAVANIERIDYEAEHPDTITVDRALGVMDVVARSVDEDHWRGIAHGISAIGQLARERLG